MAYKCPYPGKKTAEKSNFCVVQDWTHVHYAWLITLKKLSVINFETAELLGFVLQWYTVKNIHIFTKSDKCVLLTIG